MSCIVRNATQHDKMNSENIAEPKRVRLLVSKEELHGVPNISSLKLI